LNVELAELRLKLLAFAKAFRVGLAFTWSWSSRGLWNTEAAIQRRAI
jgi:hypothetical protein